MKPPRPRITDGDAQVARTLYAALARVSGRFDREPALKALLNVQSNRRYDQRKQAWATLEVDEHRGLQQLAMAYMKGPLYKPGGVSMLEFVRQCFSAPAEAAADLDHAPMLQRKSELLGQGGDTDDGGSCGDGVAGTTGSRLDGAFAALSYLNDTIEAASLLPIRPVEQPDSRGLPAFATGSSSSRRTSGESAVRGEAADHKFRAAASAAAGQLLLAHPMQLCSSFGRSVLLICRHGDDGSVGVVVNKPTSLRLKHAASLLGGEMGRAKLGPLADNRIHVGGPVPSPLIALHPHKRVAAAATYMESCCRLRGSDQHRRLVACGTVVHLLLMRIWDSLSSNAGSGRHLSRRELSAKLVRRRRHDTGDEASDEPGRSRGFLAGAMQTGMSSATPQHSTAAHLELMEEEEALAADPEVAELLLSTPDGGGLYATRVDIDFLREAEVLLNLGAAVADDFKLILGRALWGTQQLEGELLQNDWYGAAASPSTILNISLQQQHSRKAQSDRAKSDGASSPLATVSARSLRESADEKAEAPVKSSKESGSSTAGRLQGNDFVPPAPPPVNDFVLPAPPPVDMEDDSDDYEDYDYLTEEMRDVDGDELSLDEDDDESEDVDAHDAQGQQRDGHNGRDDDRAASSSLDRIDDHPFVAFECTGETAATRSRREAQVWQLMRNAGAAEGHARLQESQRLWLLHMVLDEEFLPRSGRRMWGQVVHSLGGEYEHIAALAHTQEEQCAQLMDNGDEDGDTAYVQIHGV